MKQVTKSLVIVGAMLAAGSAAADMDMDFHPFIGVDYLQAWMPAKGSITTFSRAARTDTINAKSAFRSSFPGATVYVGSKFTDCFGIELGWDSSLSSKKKTAASPSTSAVTGGYTYTSKVRREGFHADLMGFLPMMDCWNLFGTIGWGSVKAKITDQKLVANTAAGQAVLNAGTSAIPLSTKRKSILRLGVGTSYMFTDMFGVRAKLGYEGTNALRVKYSNGATGNTKVFKDTVTLAVGLFAQF